MSTAYRRVLDQVTKIRGVRGALFVAGEDGIVVADSVIEGIKPNAVAALACSLARRVRLAADSAGVGAPEFVHVQAIAGTVCVVPATANMLVVVIAEPEVNVGLLRLAMRKAAEVGA